jgi:hypothetical protein
MYLRKLWLDSCIRCCKHHAHQPSSQHADVEAALTTHNSHILACVPVPQASEAVNVVDFNVSGLSMAGGALTIRAAYTPSSPTRVDIKFKEATLVSKMWGMLGGQQ